MTYPERLSEKLVLGGRTGHITVSAVPAAIGSVVDMRTAHRAIGYFVGGWIVGAVTLAIQASTQSAFGGTPTTIGNAVGTAANTVLSVPVSGEMVQSQRAAEDRWIRAVVTTGGGTIGEAFIVSDCDRFKP